MAKGAIKRRCNYCLFEDLKKAAEKRNQLITTMPNPTIGPNGVDVKIGGELVRKLTAIPEECVCGSAIVDKETGIAKQSTVSEEQKTILRQIGQRIKELRVAKGWEPRPKAGLAHPIVRFGFYEIEDGTANPRVLVLLEICRTLDTNLSELLKDIY
jgi:hypothetical protein